MSVSSGASAGAGSNSEMWKTGLILMFLGSRNS